MEPGLPRVTVARGGSAARKAQLPWRGLALKPAGGRWSSDAFVWLGRLRLVLPLAVALLFGHRLAAAEVSNLHSSREEGWNVAARAAQPAEWPTLRLATRLGLVTQRQAMMQSEGGAQTASRKANEREASLRLQIRIEEAPPAAGTASRIRLPSGELNAGEWVRASRVQVRQGAVYLVGNRWPDTDSGGDSAEPEATD